ncbi:MAG: polysaccharide biosynthesis/export family protein [Nitrospirota bacterium]
MKKGILVFILIFLFSCATTGDIKKDENVSITGIEVQDCALTIRANKPFIYTISKSNNPNKIIIELPNVNIGEFNSKIISNKAGIREIIPSQILLPNAIAKIEVMLRKTSIFTPEYKDNAVTIIIQELETSHPPLDTDVSVDKGYTIGDEDVLQISVWGSPELTVEVPVRPDGMISAPLVGDVKVAGLTPQELKIKLEKELTKYIKAPSVSVIVTAINSFKIFVIGEGVSTSGTITLRRNTTLLQLLSQLGSLQNADLNNSSVIRGGQKLAVDLYKLVIKGDITQDVHLRPNDTIFIPDNFTKRIMVVGAVRTPSSIPYREGMTTLDAILSAGGFTEFADQNDVVIVRKEGNEVRNIEVRLKDVMKKGDINKDLSLKPGDRIIVKTGGIF